MLARVEAPTNGMELRARYRGAHDRLWGPPPAPRPRPVIIAPVSEPAMVEPRPGIPVIDDDSYSSLLLLWNSGVTKRRLNCRQICEHVAKHFGITYADLRSPSREPFLVRARWTAMFICRRGLGYSYSVIAKATGRTDHSTVFHGVSQLSARMAADPVLSEEVTTLVVACGGAR